MLIACKVHHLNTSRFLCLTLWYAEYSAFLFISFGEVCVLTTHLIRIRLFYSLDFMSFVRICRQLPVRRRKPLSMHYSVDHLAVRVMYRANAVHVKSQFFKRFILPK
jgi:hypothetical protein